MVWPNHLDVANSHILAKQHLMLVGLDYVEKDMETDLGVVRFLALVYSKLSEKLISDLVRVMGLDYYVVLSSSGVLLGKPPSQKRIPKNRFPNDHP